MKSVKLKTYQEGIKEVTTKIIITMVIDHSKTGGSITTSDQRKRMKILDLLDAAGEELELEDDDYAFLQDLVENMIWAVSNTTIRDFLKEFS